jgi:polyphosphate kinase
MKNKALTEPERLISQSSLYINRELSWLEFNYRVLAETWDKNNPLFEKLKFLAIFSSNLDEFFMIRVASLADQIHASYNLPDPAGYTPRQQLGLIAEIVQKMVKKQYSIFNRSIRPALEKSGFHLLAREQLSAEQKNYLSSYFLKQLFPALTPMAVDRSRPFPLVLNRSLNLAVLVEEDPELEPVFATVQVPSVLPRLLELPKADKDGASYILLEDVILLFINQLFSRKKILAVSPYRITRNSDLQFAEEDAADLVKEIEKSLKRRRWGAALRLEIDAGADQRILSLLKKSLEIRSRDIYQIKGPIDLSFLMKAYSNKKFNNLKYLPMEPILPAEYSGVSSTFDLIARGDRFLHHPYDSFDPVTAFVEEAALDPDVLAIKQTLYRVSGDSPIIKALGEAAERGKQVTVLLEVKARFDEESNINWAKRLEQAGCHVIYGLVGLKTHSKITLVVRLEEGKIKRYLHLGTGNYNDNTARLYTDMGLFTANDRYGAEASAFFNMLTGCSEPPDLHKLIAAPSDLRPTFNALIRREAENARRGEKAYIVAQINSLADKKIIAELYAASIAGVKIDLLVRGICCLRPGIKSVSENIRVHSIVGRFLEHSRIYRFCASGDDALYLSSADWMTRNLDRRVELLFQVEDEAIKTRIEKILDVMFSDTLKTRVLESDGSYRRIDKRGRQKINAQELLLEEAENRALIASPDQSTGSNPGVMQPIFSPGAN